MAETINISKMAEQLASAIFGELKWQQEGPENTNFDCVLEDHEKLTHPADVVYSYRHPYTGHKVYVVLDLKSYARNTIGPDSIRSSITNLALSVDCAKISDKFRERFISCSENIDLIGLLFIFNHDEGFDTEFASFLSKVYETYPKVPAGVSVCVLGPQDVWYINNIVYDMKVLRGEGVLPISGQCTFLYPDLSRAKVAIDDWGCAATIECLKSPWQIVKFRKDDGTIHLLVYYRGAGDTVQEFVYLIDKLVHFQWVAMCSTITLRAPYASQNAPATFGLAVKEYAQPSVASDAENEKLKKIRLQIIQKVTPNFSEIEIGMVAR